MNNKYLKKIKKRLRKIPFLYFVYKKFFPFHHNSIPINSPLPEDPATIGILKQELMEEDLFEVADFLKDIDKDHVWAFNAGNDSKQFIGNPKYLFVYINNHREDIKAYWLCSSAETVKKIRDLGFHAYLSGSPSAAYAIERTGVGVSEQVKFQFPFKNAKYLNLWHGMGYKRTERSLALASNEMQLEIASKYIKNHQLYRNQMLLLVTCPMQENQFLVDFALPSDQLLRAGYPRCSYSGKYEPICTYDHNILRQKGLPYGTTIAVYAPTFRQQKESTFSEAIADLNELHKRCEESNTLLIFKMHPLTENDPAFIEARESFGEHKYFIFWDNSNDIYEIINEIDLLIYDYSSIFSDFLAAGVKKYIRYIYDMHVVTDQYFESSDAYYERTAGTICSSFQQLLEALSQDQTVPSEELQSIHNMQWEYSTDNDFETIIDSVMQFEIKTDQYPTLYSFDIFDTLISRKGLAPASIFYRVQENIAQNSQFPSFFSRSYPQIRQNAELDVREYMNKTKEMRQSDKVEITLKEIVDRIAQVYQLDPSLSSLLYKWEIDAELDAVIPVTEQIELLKELLCNKEHVVLISDMYLPKDVILKMLLKADPILINVPLFLSSEYGVLKTSRLLFFEVFKSFSPFYNFKNWIHFGDNENADIKQSRRLNIDARKIHPPHFNGFESGITTKLQTYDGFLVAALQSRMRKQYFFSKSDFVVDFVATSMVPYVDWVLRDALSRGTEIMYFVSRDGYHLKRIADAIISEHQWPIQTKYIYASRRTWRIPSYFEEIDEDFWAIQGGNFNDISSKEKLLRALDIDDEEIFYSIFPHIDLNSIDFSDWSAGQPARKLVPIFRNSEQYHSYLLNRAEKQRALVCEYMRQEIDHSRKIAFCEYWGRGYNQLCHKRLWDYVIQENRDLEYYYLRSVNPTEDGCIRHHITVKNTDMLFMESIFANMPYKSIESYQYTSGRVEPVLEEIECDWDLYEAMEKILPDFAAEFAKLQLHNPSETDRQLVDYLLDYYNSHKRDPFLFNNIGGLKDAVAMFGKKMDYARPYTASDLDNFQKGIPRGRGTRSITMSFMRTDPDIQQKYMEMYQLKPQDDVARGRLLKKNELGKSKAFHNRFLTVKRRAEVLASLYAQVSASCDISPSILIVSRAKSPNRDTLFSLNILLDNNPDIHFDYLQITESTPLTEDLAKTIAQARLVLIENGVSELNLVDFSPSSISIVLRPSGFKLYKYGATLSNHFLWRQQLDAFIEHVPANYYENPSLGQEPLLMQSHRVRKSALQEIRGACITDVYFSDIYKKNALNKLQNIFPCSENKKVIVYMPTIRNKKGYSNWLELIDLEKLQGLIKNDYVVALDLRGAKELLKNARNHLELSGFSRIIPQKSMSTRELLSIADIVIGDYRDTFFESALLNIPVFSTACDLATMKTTPNFISEFADEYPFPIVEDAKSLADMISNLDDYNYQPLQKFKEKYLTWCDGCSAERIIDLFKAEISNQGEGSI